MINIIKNIIFFPLKLVFYYPGRIILWHRYFFPSKGKHGAFISVAEGRRQFKEGGVLIAFIVSCSFWGATIVILCLMGG